MDKLDLIIEKLESFDELKHITKSLRHGQEVTNSKLDVLTLEVRRLQGESVRFEGKATAIVHDLINHDYTIDILNRRQLQLEADMQQFKNR